MSSIPSRSLPQTRLPLRPPSLATRSARPKIEASSPATVVARASSDLRRSGIDTRNWTEAVKVTRNARRVDVGSHPLGENPPEASRDNQKHNNSRTFNSLPGIQANGRCNPQITVTCPENKFRSLDFSNLAQFRRPSAPPSSAPRWTINLGSEVMSHYQKTREPATCRPRVFRNGLLDRKSVV